MTPDGARPADPPSSRAVRLFDGHLRPCGAVCLQGAANAAGSRRPLSFGACRSGNLRGGCILTATHESQGLDKRGQEPRGRSGGCILTGGFRLSAPTSRELDDRSLRDPRGGSVGGAGSDTIVAGMGDSDTLGGGSGEDCCRLKTPRPWSPRMFPFALPDASDDSGYPVALLCCDVMSALPSGPQVACCRHCLL